MSVDKLIAFQKRVDKGKRQFKILLLGPGHPSRAKRVYRDELKAELKRSYQVYMMEDYGLPIALDDKFSKIITGKNLIAGIFAKNAGREGLVWEVGYLEGFARGKDLISKGLEGLLEFQRTFVAWVQTGMRDEITQMITQGVFWKIEVLEFKGQRDLVEDVRRVCHRKFYSEYGKGLWA